MNSKLVVILIILFILLICFAVFVAVSIISSRRPMEALEAEGEIARRIDGIVRKDSDVRNAVVAVDAPLLGVNLRHSAGEAFSGVPMETGTRYHSASVGKLQTAAAVFSLISEGTLGLDDPIGKFIDTARWEGLLEVDGIDRTGELTIRQLLSHRTGLADHFEDRAADGSPNTMAVLVNSPEKTWTIESRLEYVRDHFKPVGLPGGKSHYADTNFDLLALVLEGATGKDFESIRRDRVLVPTGMIESEAWPPLKTGGTDIARVWVDDVEVSTFPGISVDGPGGGLAVTIEDQVSFMRSLTDGARPTDLEKFMPADGDWGKFVNGIDYGYGLMAIRPGSLSPFMRGYPVLFGHSGSTGSFLYYVPEYDAVLAGTFNTTAWGRSKHVIFILNVLSILRRTALSSAS